MGLSRVISQHCFNCEEPSKDLGRNTIKPRASIVRYEDGLVAMSCQCLSGEKCNVRRNGVYVFCPNHPNYNAFSE